MMLSRNEILKRIQEQGLIDNYRDLDVQLQQCGFDIRVDRVWQVSPFKADSMPVIDFDNSMRHIPELVEQIPMEWHGEHWYYLKWGSYLIRSMESMYIPSDLCAISAVRSSIMRTGAVTTDSPLFDPGYYGPDNTSILVPESGLKLMHGARYTQMVFFELSSPVGEDSLYTGVYTEKKGQ